MWDALLHMPTERRHVALGVPVEDSPVDTFRQPSWLPGFLVDLVLTLVIGLVVKGYWHESWAHLVHASVLPVLRGRHQAQAQEDSRSGGDAYEDPLRDHLQDWLDTEPVYGEQWTLHLLAGILDTLPSTSVLGQEGARPPALWQADKLHLPPDSVRLEQDPRSRAMRFALAAGPAFLASLCDTFWGADGHLAALIGTCAYGLSANRSSVFVTGAPGSGKTRSCAFLGVLVACLTGNESVRAYVEAADRLTTGSHSFVRSRIVRVPANKEKDMHKLPFDAHDAWSGLLVAATHGTVVARLSFPYSALINRLKDVEILLRDEAQQVGTPESNCILAHIRHALDVMIGDHRQPAGGSRPNYHFVTELLEKKTCGLNAIPSTLFTPATLPEALRQIQHGPGTWKKGQGEMPSWGKSTVQLGTDEPVFTARSMLEPLLCLCHAKPKQAETVMQAAGLKSICEPAVNISLSTSTRLPPKISAILYACRYPEACLFALGGRDATLLMPQGPSLHHMSARPLRSPAGRWLETCRWVSIKDHPEGKSKLGTSLELSWLIADIMLTFGHQIYDDAPIGFVSQYAKIVLQIKFLLRSSYPEEELGDKNMSLMEARQTSCDFPLRGRPSTWDMGAFKNFLNANFGALKRYFTGALRRGLHTEEFWRHGSRFFKSAGSPASP